MADTQEQSLTLVTAGNTAWYVRLVKDPTGTPESVNITMTDFLEILNSLTEDTTPDGLADYLLTYDASASTVKKVLPTNLLKLSENEPITLDAALSADGKYSGIVEAGTAGATLAFGDLVYLAAADSRWELTDADAAATAGPVKIGICVLAAASDGDATTILLYGKVRADAVFPTFTIGAPVYIDTTAGDVTVTAPSGSADIVRIVGKGNTADELFFKPDETWIELA
jgi:hypothetical protein